MMRKSQRRLAVYATLALGIGSFVLFFTWIHMQKNGSNPEAKILCWLMIQEQNLLTKGEAVRDTWTRRCDKVLFFSTKFNSSFPTVVLNIPEGRKYLTFKSVKASLYSFQFYGQEFDWFLKADDDTYVIVENLRRFLKPLAADEPLYLGYRFKPYTPQGYMSGGAGYVLSREALRLLVTKGIRERGCGRLTGAEDLDIGTCLSRVGVKAINSLDEAGLETFHPMNIHEYFDNVHTFPSWMDTYSYNPVKKGFNCCSNYTISFHYLTPRDMYVLEFLIYKLRH